MFNNLIVRDLQFCPITPRFFSASEQCLDAFSQPLFSLVLKFILHLKVTPIFSLYLFVNGTMTVFAKLNLKPTFLHHSNITFSPNWTISQSFLGYSHVGKTLKKVARKYAPKERRETPPCGQLLLVQTVTIQFQQRLDPYAGCAICSYLSEGQLCAVSRIVKCPLDIQDSQMETSLL